MNTLAEILNETPTWRLDLDEVLEHAMATAKRTFDPKPFMEIIERAYLVDPSRTHSDLAYLGLHELAAKLKAEYTSGALRQNVEATRGLPAIYVDATRKPPDS